MVSLTAAMKAGKSVEKGGGEKKGVAGAEGCTGVGKSTGGTSVSPEDSPQNSEGGSRRNSRGGWGVWVGQVAGRRYTEGEDSA